MEEELWDLYDENRNPLGRLHRRKEPMSTPGEYHIIVNIWTINDNGEVLLTLRDPHKESDPNLWECTGGSVLAGETSAAGAVRELFEETGIRAQPEEFIFLGTQQGSVSFTDSYMVHKNVAISDLVLQAGETVDARWVTLPELDSLAEQAQLPASIARRFKHLRGKLEVLARRCQTAQAPLP